jgi:hypothetical protein
MLIVFFIPLQQASNWLVKALEMLPTQTVSGTAIVTKQQIMEFHHGVTRLVVMVVLVMMVVVVVMMMMMMVMMMVMVMVMVMVMMMVMVVVVVMMVFWCW